MTIRPICFTSNPSSLRSDIEQQKGLSPKHTELSLMATKQSMYHEMQGLSVNAAATTHKMNTPHSFLIS